MTQDQWVLDTVQTVLPREIHTSCLEQDLIQEEIQKMILKWVVTELTSSESRHTQGFY